MKATFYSSNQNVLKILAYLFAVYFHRKAADPPLMAAIVKKLYSFLSKSFLFETQSGRLVMRNERHRPRGGAGA